MNKCYVCDVELSEMNWYPSRQRRNDRICIECFKKREKEYRNRRNEEAKQYHKDKAAIQNLWKKLKVLNHYATVFDDLGNPACSNPYGQHKTPYSDLRALSLDHIEGGGIQHRKSIRGHSYWNWFIVNNYPPGFQVLCMNCQWIKRVINRECEETEKIVAYA